MEVNQDPGLQWAVGTNIVNTLVIPRRVSPSMNTPRLSSAVANFKSVFNANPKILTLGQFHIHYLVHEEMNKDITTDLNAKPDAELNQIWNNMKNVNSKTLINKIKSRGIEANYPNIVKAYSKDNSATPIWAKTLYDHFWNGDTINPSPNIIPATLDRYLVAFDQEKGACYKSTRALARKYIKAKGLQPIPNSLKISLGQIANANVVRDPLSNLDNVVYGNPQALQQIISNIKKALDASYLVECGVLSGVKHEMSQFPIPEHYVLVFAYDGDTFVFWDSDVTVSNIKATGWGKGFGVLFATNNTFSTGFDSVDLMSVDVNGNHLQLSQRHRYQVYYVQTLPV
ncbi:MAG: hypothetical protein J5U17_11045 [Candidatus Methanoperedens sp.]|nr:hypothetical protein [Candidatus Methanoperedens sp.]MCE8429588.1 hypothetical protein [Candidatus Methanoperedens sp.]